MCEDGHGGVRAGKEGSKSRGKGDGGDGGGAGELQLEMMRMLRPRKGMAVGERQASRGVKKVAVGEWESGQGGREDVGRSRNVVKNRRPNYGGGCASKGGAKVGLGRSGIDGGMEGWERKKENAIAMGKYGGGQTGRGCRELKWDGIPQ